MDMNQITFDYLCSVEVLKQALKELNATPCSWSLLGSPVHKLQNAIHYLDIRWKKETK